MEGAAGPEVEDVDEQVHERQQQEGEGCRRQDEGQRPKVLVHRDQTFILKEAGLYGPFVLK